MSARHAPRISSVSSLSASASTSRGNASSILRGAFSPSRLQLSLFASVIQSLDSQQLRIHDTTTGRLRCEHLQQKSQITALDWGYYGDACRIPDEEAPKKRRRRDESGSGQGERGVVVAFGTDKGQIKIFSPAEGKVLSTLPAGHNMGIRDFRFKNFGLEGEAWSAGGEGRLLQWDLRTNTITRNIMGEPANPSTLLPLFNSLLVASETTWLIDLSSEDGAMNKLGQGERPTQYLLADISPVQDGLPSSYLAAFEDRYLNVYDVTTARLVGSLVAESDVSSISTYQGDLGEPVIAAITTNGVVELFTDPFSFKNASKSSDLKSQRKQMTKKSTASVQIARPDAKSTQVPLAGVSFQDNDLVIAYVEGGVHLGFERVPWKDGHHDGLMLQGATTIIKANSLLGKSNGNMNGVKDMGHTQINESKAVVARGSDNELYDMFAPEAEVIAISSAEEEESDDDDFSDSPEPPKAITNGVHADSQMTDADGSEGSADEGEGEGEARAAEEPSFGDLVRASAPDVIDVAAAFTKPDEKQMAASRKNISKASSGMSLATVLSQSLRTNDVSLLESCFHEQNLHVVRATIERLDSSLAVSLVKKLAERLHSRPGRAGSLMVWVQWTLVAHGGYLGSQPAVVRQLSSLHQVVKDRASSLQPLLRLKGKLDMLEAQMNMRKSMQKQFGMAAGNSEEADEAVIYVEGQEDSGSDDSSVTESTAPGADDVSDMGGEDDGVGMPSTMDVDEDSGMESDDDLIDDEASDSSDDGSDEEDLSEEVDHDDLDSEDDVSEEAGPAPKVKSKKLTNGNAHNKR